MAVLPDAQQAQTVSLNGAGGYGGTMRCNQKLLTAIPAIFCVHSNFCAWKLARSHQGVLTAILELIVWKQYERALHSTAQ